MTVTAWTITGADEQPILGDAHVPEGPARGVVVLAHGFMGYKDYGMFPRIACTCADAGFVVHRFNFSHSGMTNEIDTFARPDLFERGTWNKQVHDLRAVVTAIRAGTLTGGDLPLIMFGHSRGGVATLLTAGRHGAEIDPAGIVTAASPSSCWRQEQGITDLLLEQGWLPSPSSRTGQELRVGKAFLTEQLDDPDGHDVVALAARIDCPVLVVHGDADPTVTVDDARVLTDAIGRHARSVLVENGDHVFNTPNPLPDDAPSSRQLKTLLDALTSFANEVT